MKHSTSMKSMPVYERINVVVSLALVGLALYFVLAFPVDQLSFNLFGSPVGLASSWRWLMIILLTGLAMAGADAVMELQPALVSRRLGNRAAFWTLPGLVIIFATQTLGLTPDPITWAVSLILIGVLLWLTLLAQFLQGSSEAGGWSGWWQQVIGYGLAAGLFILIFYTRQRTVLSASAVFLVSLGVALPLLRAMSVASPSRIWLLALVISAGLAQITWALNYWRAAPLQTGLLLVLVLYTLIGLTQQYLLNTLTRRAVWEFGLVAAVVIGLIIYV